MDNQINDAEIIEQVQTASPLPQKGQMIVTLLSFPQALEHLKEGKHITKDEWKDNDIYGLLDSGEVRLHKKDGKNYQWIISEGDLVGEDWIVLA